MAKVARVKKVKRVGNNKTKKQLLISSTKKRRSSLTPRINVLTIEELVQRLEALKSLSKAKGITLEDSLKYVSKERIERMKKQLSVMYIAKIDRYGTMRFSVKSSGLTATHKAYFVDIRLNKLLDAVRAKPNATIKDLIMPLTFKTQCTCADFKYRFAYWHTLFNTIIGIKEFKPTNITNQNAEHLFLCKHQALVFTKILEKNFRLPYIQQVIKNAKMKDMSSKIKKKIKKR